MRSSSASWTKARIFAVACSTAAPPASMRSRAAIRRHDTKEALQHKTDRHEAPSGRGRARPGAAHAPGLQETGYQRADVLPLAEGRARRGAPGRPRSRHGGRPRARSRPAAPPPRCRRDVPVAGSRRAWIRGGADYSTRRSCVAATRGGEGETTSPPRTVRTSELTRNFCCSSS